MSVGSFEFVKTKFDAKRRQAEFFYRQSFSDKPSLTFHEVVAFPSGGSAPPRALLDGLLRDLHLVLGVSYYKLYCPSKITVPYRLTDEQAAFWNMVYRKGLGEFFYRNKIDSKRCAKFPSDRAARARPTEFLRRDRVLVGIGGGKDSAVTIELLKKEKMPQTGFIVETTRRVESAEAVARVAGIQTLTIRRTLDPKVFDEHAYNGHIPVSAIFAFLGVAAAVFNDYRWVAVGNEASSNFGNLRWRGEEINHQWSKSAEFEALFQDYVRCYVTADVQYFSALRPFSEIRIVKMFARMKKYHRVFSSCNRQEVGWCGQCAKCAFMFAMLAAFLPRRTVTALFGKDLLADPALRPLYRDLTGRGKMKPFDCVGTFEETRAALRAARGGRIPSSVLRTSPAPTVPPRFIFLGTERVLLLGYGVEGKTTHKFLKKFYPQLAVATTGAQEDFDLGIRTPGMPTRKVHMHYTTATNIFFSRITNLTVGVTGTKGKSTTVSLIYAMLRAARRPARLLGNIGTPMLGALHGRIRANEIMILELSSYMLEDIKFSPDIAVVLDLFPEHMDHHGSVEKYYDAKLNIIPPDAVKRTFDTKLPVRPSEIKLMGAHNLENARAAATVARHLGVPEAAIRRALINFKPLPHRLEHVGTFRSIQFYDDAISTTPESTIMAIKTLKNVGTIFLGGEDRGYDFRELERTIRRYKIKNVVLFPDSGRRIFRSTVGLRVLRTTSMRQAVKFAYKYTPRGTICLLSAASPSYSLWKNFEEKGREFVRAVKSV